MPTRRSYTPLLAFKFGVTLSLQVMFQTSYQCRQHNRPISRPPWGRKGTMKKLPAVDRELKFTKGYGRKLPSHPETDIPFDVIAIGEMVK